MRGLPVDIERSPVAARLSWLFEKTIERALTAEDIEREFALPALVGPSSVIDRITGPWPIERVGRTGNCHRRSTAPNRPSRKRLPPSRSRRPQTRAP